MHRHQFTVSTGAVSVYPRDHVSYSEYACADEDCEVFSWREDPLYSDDTPLIVLYFHEDCKQDAGYYHFSFRGVNSCAGKRVDPSKIRRETYLASSMLPTRLRVTEQPRFRILGFDDWLIYARDRWSGALYFAVTETDPRWADAPNKGEAGYGSDGWREDHAFMLKTYQGHADADSILYWQPCEFDMDGKSLAWPVEDDPMFIVRSHKIYLPEGAI